MPQFIYNAYGKEHTWQARADKYTNHGQAQHPKTLRSKLSTREAYLAWLRQEWKAGGAVKHKLVAAAQAWKKSRRWVFKIEEHTLKGKTILSVIETLINKGLV